MGQEDPMHKLKESSTPIIQPPFYAIDVSIKNSSVFPVPSLTLGRLKVNEKQEKL